PEFNIINYGETTPDYIEIGDHTEQVRKMQMLVPLANPFTSDDGAVEVIVNSGFPMNPLMHFNETQRIGVNTNTPANLLHIADGAGDVLIDKGVAINSRMNSMDPEFNIINYGETTPDYIEIGDHTEQVRKMQMLVPLANPFTSDDGAVEVIVNSGLPMNPLMHFNETQRIGVNTNSPQELLHVNGKVKIGAYTLPDTDGTNGQVLATNGTGIVAWTTVAASSGWELTGNAGTNAATNFIGTTDAQDVVLKRNNTEGMRLSAGGALLATGNTTSGITPTSGAGTRMMWIPAKRAFRAGEVNAAQWDDANVGLNSAAFGSNTRASGVGSFAINQNTVVSGNNSFAMGFGCTTSGNLSFSGGQNSTTSGSYAFSFGNSTTSSGFGSIALSDRANAGADFAVAIGQWVSATSSNAMVIGMGPGVNLTNSISRSLMIGFNSDLPTFFVGTSAGAGTTGNVGIGTSTPGAKLEVNGQVKITGGIPGAGKVLTSDATGLATWQALSASAWTLTGNSGTNAATNYIGTADATDFVTRTNNTERMRVSSTGNVGIGTAAPGRKLHVSGAENTLHGFNACVGISNTSAGGTDWYLRTGATGTATPAGGFSIADNVGYRFVIDNTGNVGLGTTTPGFRLQVGNSGDGTVARANAWTVFSDERLKKDFSSIENPVKMINEISGYYYYWKSGTDTSLQIGFKAQEIEKVIPQIVSTDANGIKSVDYARVTPVIIEAVKEQQAEIESQKNEIEVLKKQYNELLKLLNEKGISSENNSMTAEKK
ncbi:MAG: tail fiber domain-containing protein, partial [Bacteroidota bacterium]